jgi:hypothetical protein
MNKFFISHTSSPVFTPPRMAALPIPYLTRINTAFRQIGGA